MTTRIENLILVKPSDGPLAALIRPLRMAFNMAKAAHVHARMRREAINELSVLSDGQLQDIGVRRSQISEVVDGSLAGYAGVEASPAASRGSALCYGSRFHA